MGGAQRYPSSLMAMGIAPFGHSTHPTSHPSYGSWNRAGQRPIILAVTPSIIQQQYKQGRATHENRQRNVTSAHAGADRRRYRHGRRRARRLGAGADARAYRAARARARQDQDRKSTRLNSSHLGISY